MATTGKERQRKYKQRLKALNKKSVTVDLSENAYSALIEKKIQSGENFSTIVEKMVSNGFFITSGQAKNASKSTHSIYESENLKTIFENANDVIIYINLEGKILDINKRVRDIFGYTRENSIGKKITEFNILHPDDLELSLKDLSNISQNIARPNRRGLDLSLQEFKAYHEDGTPVYIEVNSRLVEKNGEKEGILTIIRDITERKQTEKALLESEERFRSVLENSSDVIYRANLQKNTFDYVSPSSKSVLGYTPEEMIALGYKVMISQVHPDDYDRMNAHFDLSATPEKENIEATIEFRTKHKKLGYHWISHTRTLIFNERNEPIAVVGNVRDITKRKKAEEELRKLHEELEINVKERTVSLEDANTALKVLLKRLDEDKRKLEEKILLNLKELIAPIMERLKTSGIDTTQKAHVELLESGLNNIFTPFSRKLTSKYLNFTHGEIQVANLIKHGKTTKEISQLLNLSSRTIDFHRSQIRKKIGINNKKVNLRSYLLSLQ